MQKLILFFGQASFSVCLKWWYTWALSQWTLVLVRQTMSTPFSFSVKHSWRSECPPLLNSSPLIFMLNIRMWLGLIIFSGSRLDSVVSKGVRFWILVWVVLVVDYRGIWLGLFWIFSLNPNDFNEFCFIVWKLILVGAIAFLFGATVLSKVNVLLVVLVLVLVYAFNWEVLEIIGYHLELSICNCSFWVDESFDSLVFCDDEDRSDCLLM